MEKKKKHSSAPAIIIEEIEPESLEYEYEPGIGLSAMKFSTECEMIKRGRNDHCKKCRCNEIPDEGHCISCTCHQESGLENYAYDLGY